MRVVGKLMAVVAGLGILTGSASAAEVSLISGLYKKEDKKVNGTDAGGGSSINAGGRYSDKLDGHLYWFGQADLTLRNYDAGAGGAAPKDSTSLQAGGGVRYFFSKLSESVSTFAEAGGYYRNVKKASISSSVDYSETEISGLYYGAALGFRISTDKDYFFDISAPLFDSALMANEKTTSVSVAANGQRTETTTKVNRSELWASTADTNWGNIVVGIGMRL